MKKKPTRKQMLESLRQESALARREMIRRWQALAPDRRTNFLRVKIGITATAL